MKKPLLVLATIISLVTGCMNPNLGPDSVNDHELASTRNAISRFQENERLQMYFDQAFAYAVYPNVVRAGMGIGGAYGSGWVFRDGLVDGKTRVLQLSIGAQIILEDYRHIIFFETQEAYQYFRDSELEFVGQANAALLVVGASLTPAYQNHVAAFSQLKVGAGLEASVGAHRYSFVPLAENQQSK